MKSRPNIIKYKKIFQYRMKYYLQKFQKSLNEINEESEMIEKDSKEKVELSKQTKNNINILRGEILAYQKVEIIKVTLGINSIK